MGFFSNLFKKGEEPVANWLSCRSADSPLMVGFVSLFGGMFFGLVLLCPILLLIMGYLSVTDPTKTFGLLTIAIIYIPCALVAIIGSFTFIQKTNDRLCWKLTDAELIGGREGKIIIPLQAIVKMVPHIPKDPPNKLRKVAQNLATSHLRSSGYHGPHIGDYSNWSNENTLFLILESGKRLPLFLHTVPGGTAIMKELIQKLMKVRDDHYVFTEKEIKTMKRRGVNRIIDSL